MTEHAPSAGPVVHVKIGRLTLDGYSQAQQQRFIRALDASLTRLSAGRKPGASLSSLELDKLEPIQPAAGGTVEDAARSLAQQLFRRLDQGNTHV